MHASADQPKKKVLWQRLRLLALFLMALAAGSLVLSESAHNCGGSCPVHAPAPETEILLSNWPPETVMATVDGHNITLSEVRRIRDGKLAGLPPGAQIRDAALLELMIRRHWLAESARAKGLHETDAYRETLARFRDTATADWMTQTDIEQRALAETFLEQEVIANIDIEPEDLEDMYAIFGPTLPEGTTLEEARPMFERRLKRQAVERYLRHELDQRELFFHDAWLEYIARQAKDAADAGTADGDAL